MAQTVAAHAGFEARLRGETPAIGLVLGTRAYASAVDEFPNGCTLTISVAPELVEGSFAAFNCTIETDHAVATAVLNIYRPTAEELARMHVQSRS
jgi:predicted hotdog family 3-hydroxylacyl-ACP dehydratase